ncbi:TPA: hypothetical protein R1S00_004112 [Enterobacter hormaechei]|nr:hypothetical protein [Enterobacter hormaechei]HEC0656779.1 hypothetical protein [Enterobacter hormaechei]
MATNNTNRVTQFGQLIQLVSGAADFARNVPHRWYRFYCGAPFGERGDFTHDQFDRFCFFRRGRCLRYNGMNPVFWFSIRLLLMALRAAKSA